MDLETPSPQPLPLEMIVLMIAAAVMVPSAIASWYSKCYNISLIYGFVIVFSSVLVSYVSSFFPDEIRNYIQSFNTIVLCFLIVYGVILQFGGHCNLGK